MPIFQIFPPTHSIFAESCNHGRRVQVEGPVLFGPFSLDQRVSVVCKDFCATHKKAKTINPKKKTHSLLLTFTLPHIFFFSQIKTIIFILFFYFHSRYLQLQLPVICFFVWSLALRCFSDSCVIVADAGDLVIGIWSVKAPNGLRRKNLSVFLFLYFFFCECECLKYEYK